MTNKTFTIGSILHGAYGDYYEQMLCLKQLKLRHPDKRLVLFFASAQRHHAFSVLDLNFADAVLPIDLLEKTNVETFHQYQVCDPELRGEILDKLSPELRRKIDDGHHRKPWIDLRKIDFRRPESHISLNEKGRQLLSKCYSEKSIQEDIFDRQFTVGLLWRYYKSVRLSTKGLPPEQVVRNLVSELGCRLIEDYNAHLIVNGMNTPRTEENWHRNEAKYTDVSLDTSPEKTTYMHGSGWPLDLEIMARCDVCIVMPSGFSEALWIKRTKPTFLFFSPRSYSIRLLYHRMPFFNQLNLSSILFQLRQPQTAERVLRRMTRLGILPKPIRRS